MSEKRKNIPEKLRFEILKRDEFKCQYCGASGHEVELQIDHIHPVAKGGTNDILNLVTSCKACNIGKGARTLNESELLVTQKAHLEDMRKMYVINEQRKMIVKWKIEIEEDNKKNAESAATYILYKCKNQISLTDHFLSTLSKLINKYDYKVLLEAIDTASETYLRFDNDGNVDKSRLDNYFDKIESICYVKSLPLNEQKKIFIKSTCRKYLSNWEGKKGSILINKYEYVGGDLEELHDAVKNMNNFKDYITFISEFLEEEYKDINKVELEIINQN